MVDYHKLVSTGVINELAIANADFGVSGTPTSLRINNRLVHLVSYALFEADPKFWRLPDSKRFKVRELGLLHTFIPLTSELQQAANASVQRFKP